ncbi:GntR family transcriptional regulator [Roseibium suaedae]|uniref:GntR family transcriptional regulator n=1 Tax=Roseibium suaedae TaxID=735517 RepID=A0A1M7LF69_9HYPH|nr:GntR family transcriptional regulator [Roseibium suaedae]SHM76840.1 GntR family transcriptional regulator [Roseibium suaedae]
MPDEGLAGLAAVEPDVRIPLWAQVKAAITTMIAERGLQPDDKLPSETEFCDLYGVSRIVVRQAMSRLVNEGLIYRQQGRGAFVAAPSEDTDFVGRIIGFSGDLGVKNHKVTRKVLEVGYRTPSTRIRRLLDMEDHEEVAYLNRVMSVDGVPRILVESCLVARKVPGFLDLCLEDRSLYAMLRENYGIEFTGAERWVEAANASEEEARLLDVTPGTALLRIESRSSVKDGSHVEYFSALYRADQARLHFAIKTDTGSFR